MLSVSTLGGQYLEFRRVFSCTLLDVVHKLVTIHIRQSCSTLAI